MREKVAIATVAFACLVAGYATAAEKLTQVVASGLACYEQLNFGCTISKLQAARGRLQAGEVLSAADQLLACETLAFAYASIERPRDAEASFGWCFEVDPTYKLDADVVGPRIYPHFERARQSLLRSRLDLTPVLPAWPEPVGVESRLDLVLHTPTEILLSGSGELESRTHLIGFGTGASFLFGSDAEDFEPGFQLGLEYQYTTLAWLRILGRVQFAAHSSARTDVKPGYPSELYTVTASLGLLGVVPVGDFVEIHAGVHVGGLFTGLKSLSDRSGTAVAGRIGVSFRIGSDFSAGLDLDPTCIIATLTDGSLGTSFVFPVTAHFDARF